MDTGPKLAAYALALGVALGGGALVGNVVGPIAAADEDTEEHDDTHEAEPAAAPVTGTVDEDMPAGVLISQDGYTLDAVATTFAEGSTPRFEFRIVGSDGTTVEDFVVDHERELHLIVVGTDLGSYAHLHPTRGDDGTWSVQLPALAPGVYRAFADFAVADGPELTLGVDVIVAGDAVPAALPEPASTVRVDGFDVTLAGAPEAGSATELTVSVERDGVPVTDLEPYLGAFGHLVAIRGGDLAYLHVHPVGDVAAGGDRGGPGVEFSVDVPSPGDYRLFFDFAHAGKVRTAGFTVSVPAAGDGSTGGGAGHSDSEGHG
jgi:hypothetical protein